MGVPVRGAPNGLLESGARQHDIGVETEPGGTVSTRSHIVIVALYASACLLCTTQSAHGQDTLSVAARLVMRQPAGIMLRLNAASEQVTGLLERVDAGSVYLTDPPRVVALSSITDAWLQRRSTGRGGKTGAIIGAGAGAVMFGLGAAVVSGLCEYDCGDWGAGEILVASVIGAAAGGASGYVLGALLGSSVMRWEPLTESSAPATIVSRDPRRRPGLSAFTVTPSVARAAVGNEGVGVGVGVSYLSQLSDHIALGLEAASYTVERPPEEYFCGDPDILCTTDPSSRNWTIGGLARVGTGAHRSVEPYALLGLGVTNFRITLGGYSAGAGLRLRPGSGRLGISGEGRWHSNFTNSGEDTQLGFYTFGLGLSVLR